MAKKENNDEIFEKEIGDMGGQPQQPQQPESDSLKGRRLQHVPGQKKALSEDEEAEMQAFINRSRSAGGRTRLTDRGIETIGGGEEEAAVPSGPISVSQGWIPVDRKELDIRSQFYPEDWTFYIRPATVEAVKNWSAIDEERLDVVNDVFNDIIRTCVSIKGETSNIPWSRMNSWDRFWFITKIRELTFPQGEAKVEFTDTCPECDEEIVFTLEPKALFYEFPDEEIVTKHWNAVDRIWYIDPKDYDVEGPATKFYVPTLEKDTAVFNWALRQARAKKKVNEVFLRFAPWLLAKVPKDEQVLDKFIKDCETKFKSWDVDLFNFFDDVIRNITINPSEKLRRICPHCGEEVVSNVRFPNGVKALFRTEAKHKKFGSR